VIDLLKVDLHARLRVMTNKKARIIDDINAVRTSKKDLSLGKLNPGSLEKAALVYLQRFSSSRENLRKVLMRRVWRAVNHDGGDKNQCQEWVDLVVEKMELRGFVNDRLFAEGRMHSLLTRGKSLRGIRNHLHDRGISPDIIDDVLNLAEKDEGNLDFTAAINLAKRRGLGPFSKRAGGRRPREKDMAAMARAGFSFEVAVRVIEAETPGDLALMGRDDDDYA